MPFDYICFESDWIYVILKDITSNMGHGHRFFVGGRIGVVFLFIVQLNLVSY